MLPFKIALFATFALLAVGQQTCPNNLWTYDAASATCFLVGKTLQTYANAQFYCQSQGGTLAVVHSNIVQSVLQSLAQGVDSDFYYWIGLAINGDGQFQWADGSILDVFRWCANNPTTVASNTCGVLDPNGNCWRNVNCNTYLPSICTNDPRQATTTRPTTIPFQTTTTPRPQSTTTPVILTSQSPPVSCWPDNYPQGQGNFYSPGYPGMYGNNEDCNYLLSANTGGQISLSLTRLSTEQCCDFLYLYDGPTRFSPLIQRLSGTINNPMMFNSTGQFMTLRFVTDPSDVAAGFFGSYTTSFGTTSVTVSVTSSLP